MTTDSGKSGTPETERDDEAALMFKLAASVLSVHKQRCEMDVEYKRTETPAVVYLASAYTAMTARCEKAEHDLTRHIDIATAAHTELTDSRRIGR